MELSLRRAGVTVIGDTAFAMPVRGAVVGVQIGLAQGASTGTAAAICELKVYQFAIFRNIPTRPVIAPLWESGTIVQTGSANEIGGLAREAIRTLSERLSNAFLTANPLR